MINKKQKIKLQEMLDICIDITNNTEYAAQFTYSAHVESFSISIHKKSNKSYTPIYSRHVITFDEYDRKRLDETQIELINFLNKKEVSV
jgi:hypothetical protein